MCFTPGVHPGSTCRACSSRGICRLGPELSHETQQRGIMGFLSVGTSLWAKKEENNNKWLEEAWGLMLNNEDDRKFD